MQVNDALRQTISLVDKMAGKGLIHRNTAGALQVAPRGTRGRKSAATA